MVEFRLNILVRSLVVYALVIRPNKGETAAQCFVCRIESLPDFLFMVIQLISRLNRIIIPLKIQPYILCIPLYNRNYSIKKSLTI